MIEVNYDDLEFRNDWNTFVEVYHNGQPFTGKAVSKTPDGQFGNGIFINGMGEGKFTSFFANGLQSKEWELDNGQYTGYSRWWDENGVLYCETDHVNNHTIRFYPGTHTLMYKRTAEKSIVYAPNNEPALQKFHLSSHPYERYEWNHDQMRSHYSKMLEIPFLENFIFPWFWDKYLSDIEYAYEILGVMLDHPNLWVKNTAICIVGDKKLNMFHHDIQKALEDERYLPTEWDHPEGNGRTGTNRIRDNAFETIKKLQE